MRSIVELGKHIMPGRLSKGQQIREAVRPRESRKRPVLAALISSQWMCLGCSCPHQVLCGHIGAQACYSVGEVEANPRFQGSSSAMRFTG
jgi:hypothetical protein